MNEESRNPTKEGEDPIKEINDFVNALISLAPTYSRVTQFILLADGGSYESIKEMYPDLMKDRRTRNRIFKALGLRVNNGKIETEWYSLSYYLKSIVNTLFNLFKDSNRRDRIIAALFNENISNLEEEWLASRLRVLEELSKESKAASVSIIILKILKNLRENDGYNYQWLDKDQLIENLGKEFEESLISDAIDILIKYKLLKQSDQKYGLSDDLWEYRILIDDIEVE